jgi:hypothetical protein
MTSTSSTDVFCSFRVDDIRSRKTILHLINLTTSSEKQKISEIKVRLSNFESINSPLLEKPQETESKVCAAHTQCNVRVS